MRQYCALCCAVVVLLCSSPAVAAPQTKSSKSSPHALITASPAAVVETPKSTEETNAAKLPVRRVILYKTGVGYFEHQGQVRGNQTVQIDFTSSQLNDVLQSLTVLDLNGGRVAGVNYNSEAPLSQRLGMLRLPLEEKTDLSKFYSALRGARLEIRSGTTTVTGRLLSVERKTRVSGGTTLEVDLATLVDDSGEVHSIEITPAVSVRLMEREVTQEVGRYVSLLASMRQEDVRRMTIATSGTGDRQLYVSYISETPIWKTTYRIVLPSNATAQPLLQGWAIVDNTVGEDWNDVELSLVAGAPQSFIQQLSQAYYARRPVVAMPQYAQLAPQTHDSAMLGGFATLSGTITDPAGLPMSNAKIEVFSPTGQIAATTTPDSQGHYEVTDLPAAMYRVEFTSPGFAKTVVQQASLGGNRQLTQNVTMRVGSLTQTVTVTAPAPALNTTTSEIANLPVNGRNYTDLQSVIVGPGSGRELGSGRGVAGGFASAAPASPSGMLGAAIGSGPAISEARAAMSAAAQGADLGDLFEYKLKDRVTIHKNESSLVPIVQVHVGAEKVSLWNSSMNSARPVRALWLTNSSPLTLDGGSFSVLENEAFAGEGLTDPIKPGEKRLLSYAADLGVRVDAKAESQAQRVTRVSINHGVMIRTSAMHQETTYTIRNDDVTPRQVLIEHPLRGGWELSSETPKPEESTAAVYRFRQSVDPKATVKFAVLESQPMETRFELTNLTADQIALFAREKTITPEMEAALRAIIEQKNQLAALDQQISDKDDETSKIYDDQQRLRENLKALKGTAEERALTQRYTQQLSDQETRLAAIEREAADLKTRRDQTQSKLDEMIANLTMEATL